jgi:hypothetical protein
MKFFVLALFFLAIFNNSPVLGQDETPQNINKLLNNQVIVSR